MREQPQRRQKRFKRTYLMVYNIQQVCNRVEEHTVATTWAMEQGAGSVGWFQKSSKDAMRLLLFSIITFFLVFYFTLYICVFIILPV